MNHQQIIKRWRVALAVLPLFSGWVCHAQDAPAGLTLTDEGQSAYRIVIAGDATVTGRKAAEELQSHLKRISGAELEIVTDATAPAAKEIIVGNCARLKELGIQIDRDQLGRDGYVIRTAGAKLVIAGAEPLGTLYGVFGFLEDHLGCRWYSSKVSRIPEQATIKLGAIDDRQVPAFQFREVYYADPMDPDFAARMKLNGNASTMDGNRLAVERHAGWATWCHTVFSFVPPEKYLEQHPEYYALTKGKRKTTQLCFTNPDVFDLTTAKVRELIKAPVNFEAHVNKFIPRAGGPYWATGEDHYFDISQMDRNGGQCECPRCKEIDEREGTPMGSVLHFINRVAEEFPDKTISTLSYQYTRRPPKTMRPRDNVSIMLCNIECTRARPIAQSSFGQDQAFVRDLVDWSKICDTLSIWDYCVNFSHLLAPNPNLRVQQENIRMFRDHNVRGFFMQGSREVGGEFTELRNYLIAKLLWNPDADPEAIVDDFLAGFYGPAAGPVGAYLDLLHDEAEKAPERLGIYEAPQAHANSFLSRDLLKRYDALFDQAEELVAGDPDLLHRVRTARMSIMYAKLVLSYGSPEEQMAVADQFFDLCRKNQIRRLSEGGGSPEVFRKKIQDRLNRRQGARIDPARAYLSDWEGFEVKLGSSTADAEVRYTTDGSEPDANSAKYAAPIPMTGPGTIKARAFLDGKPLGETVVGRYAAASIPFQSEVMRVHDAPALVRLSVKGRKSLKLALNTGGDSDAWDHGDWAGARLIDETGNSVLLSDLKPVSARQGWGDLGINKSVAGNKLQIDGRKFKKGLGSHAPAEIVYQLDGRYELLEAWIGVDAESKDMASVGFEVSAE